MTLVPLRIATKEWRFKKNKSAYTIVEGVPLCKKCGASMSDAHAEDCTEAVREHNMIIREENGDDYAEVDDAAPENALDGFGYL